MNAHRTCSSCGVELPADAPSGLCVPCLLKGALPNTEPSKSAPAPKSTIVVSPDIPASEKSGDRIGRYKLLQEIGEGGMGTVWMAEQEEPVRRRVALKVIKLGMDTKQVIGRFEAERQALALMDHPNIAKVLDAGATDNGRPFFVMELVKGIPITKYCDDNKLGTEKRLELFMDVCRAIQHAHQKGIIHRDIKPSNILIANHDGRPVPKVIDFGIAKATTDQKLTDKTVFTAFEQFIGTPAYMSPEQAEMNALDVDTRTDIYSLGVLLYELLTGKTPFDAKELISAGLEGMRKMIREREPARPSTRISSLSNVEQSTVATQRESEPPKLLQLVRGDLDWVAMKCLEKDRTRRYETANGLAADIERHLKNEPVVACPPSNIYRFQKFVRRNRLAFAATAAVALALLAGIAASTWQAIRATSAHRLASQQRDRAESEAQRADLNARNEQAQRERAEQANHHAKKALSMALVVEGERLAEEDMSGKALACFARAARLNPSNHVAATRIVSLLTQRNFPLPLVKRTEGFDSQAEPKKRHNFFYQNSIVGSSALHLKGKQLFDRKSNQQVSQVEFEGTLHRQPVFSSDGERMAILTSANKIEVFFTRTGATVIPPIPAVHTGSAQFVLFTPDGENLLVGGSSSALVEVWNLESGRLITKLQHQATVWATATSADGRLLVTGVRSGDARVWNLASGKQISEPCRGPTDVLEAELSFNGECLVTKHRSYFAQGEVEDRFWDVRPGGAIPITLWHASPITRAIFSPDGKLVATVQSNGIARVWDKWNGRMLAEMDLPSASITKLTFSPDSTLIALGGARKLGLRDVQKNQLKWTQTPHSGEFTAIFDRDGGRIISGGDDADQRVVITEAQSGRIIGEITNRFGAVMSLAIAPDNRHLAIGYRSYRVEIWDLDTMTRIGEPLTKDNGWIWHVVFSHNGEWLSSSSGGNAAQFWKVRQPVNQPLAAFRHGHGVNASIFSDDDRLLLTCASDRTARVWNCVTGTPVSEPLFHGRSPSTGSIHADTLYDLYKDAPRDGMIYAGNTSVLTASANGAVIWDISSSKPLCDLYSQENTISRTALGASQFLAGLWEAV